LTALGSFFEVVACIFPNWGKLYLICTIVLSFGAACGDFCATMTGQVAAVYDGEFGEEFIVGLIHNKH
jgi:hypothetical protein